jgi:hypothetical protein
VYYDISSIKQKTMTQITLPPLPSRRYFSPTAGIAIQEVKTEDTRRIDVKHKITGILGRLRQANRMEAWMENNPPSIIDIYTPRHLGEPAEEATMPALTEAPTHSAGKHIAEASDAEAATQLYIAQDGQSSVGRHVAQVPIDFIQPVAGKHRAQ